MKCDEFQAGYLSGEPAPGHLEHCRECRAELPRLDQIRSALATAEIWEELNVELENGIVGEISGHSERGPRSKRWMWPAAAVLLVVATAAITTFVLTGGRPDWEVVMAGTPNAPGAFASVSGWNTDDGVRMELKATALPTAPDGHYYEMWLSAPDRIVSAGTFRRGAEVVLWSGVARTVVPRLWVTLEAVDGNPSPSGLTVLDSG